MTVAGYGDEGRRRVLEHAARVAGATPAEVNAACVLRMAGDVMLDELELEDERVRWALTEALPRHEAEADD